MLASPLVVVAGALATFLVVLALLATRVSMTRSPAPPSTASTSAQCSSTGTARTVLRTTASGQVVQSSSGGGPTACVQGSATPSDAAWLGEEQGDD